MDRDGKLVWKGKSEILIMELIRLWTLGDFLQLDFKFIQKILPKSRNFGFAPLKNLQDILLSLRLND
jgi:hypothetical protein